MPHQPAALPIAVALALLVAGCSREPQSAAPPAAGAGVAALPADAEVNDWLAYACRAHHLAARVEGGWVVFDGSGVRMNGAVAPGASEKDGSFILQIQFQTLLPDGRLIVQPVVGWGKDRPAAIVSAEASFLLGSFHAFVGAFIDPWEQHVRREERTVGGRRRVVTYGDVLTKVFGGEEPPDDERWHDELTRLLDSVDLPPGTHWLDVYNAQVGEKQELEIQLDNQRWASMEEKMRPVPWPNNGKFTSVRQLIIIQDPADPTRPTTRPTTLPATPPDAGPSTGPTPHSFSPPATHPAAAPH